MYNKVRWCSILVGTAILKAGLKSAKGHIDEVSCVGLGRPARGLMLGVKVVGRSAMACGR